MRLKRQEGFTLIELAVVAAILVILAVVAMSSFSSSNQIEESRLNVVMQVIGSINAAAIAKRSDQIALGNTQWNEYGVLDNRSDLSTASTTNTLLFNYVNPPIVDGIRWQKLNNYCYRMDTNGDDVVDSSDRCMYWDNTTGIAGMNANIPASECSSTTCD